MVQKQLLFWSGRLLLGTVMLLAAAIVNAQTAIEVASVHEVHTQEAFPSLGLQFQPGRLTLSYLRLEDMVAYAYGLTSALRDRVIVGWPSGLRDKRFSV